MTDIVQVLASDSLQGRGVGTIHEQQSLAFIASKFRQITKRKMKAQSFSFELDAAIIESKNGYYFINSHQKETVIIGAHYDHIGLGGKLSMSLKSNEIHNGADDNASGVALLLALSQKLMVEKNAKYNYLIVFYSAHEVGLFGSTSFYEFISTHKRKFKKIKMVLNFDMIGRLHPQLKKLKCMSSAACVPFLNTEIAKQNGFSLNITDTEMLASLDTKVFYEAKIPCVNFTTGIHNDYHSVSDDAKYINYQGMNQILNFLATVLLEIK